MKIRQLFFSLGIFIASAVFTPAMAKPATAVSPETGFRPGTSTTAENFKPKKKKKKAKQKKSKKHCEAY